MFKVTLKNTSDLLLVLFGAAITLSLLGVNFLDGSPLGHWTRIRFAALGIFFFAVWIWLSRQWRENAKGTTTTTVSDPDVARHIIANVPILEMRQYLTDLYVAKARKAKKIDLTTLTMETFLNAYYENLPR